MKKIEKAKIDRADDKFDIRLDIIVINIIWKHGQGNVKREEIQTEITYSFSKLINKYVLND